MKWFKDKPCLFRQEISVAFLEKISVWKMTSNYDLDPSQAVGVNRLLQQAIFSNPSGQHQQQQHQYQPNYPQQQQYSVNPIFNSQPMNTRVGKRDTGMPPQPPPQHPPHHPSQRGGAEQQLMSQNPFDTLGIPRTTTDEMLVNEVYRKWVSALHPDRGGDPRRFQEVTRAYRMVIEVIQHARNESFDALKRQAERDLGSIHQADYSGAPLGNGEGFNKTRFNEVFQDHRMWNPEDDGYADQMIQSEYTSGGALGGSKFNPDELIMQREREFLRHDNDSNRDDELLQKFNRGNFNQAFERRVQNVENPYSGRGSQDYSSRGSTSMVVRTEPEEMTMLRNMGSRCTTLSVDKIDDFSSPFLGGGAGPSSTPGGGCGYTDYMRAFSKDSLITPHVADSQGHGYKTVKELEAERANLSFIPSAEILNARAQQEATLKEQDEMRWRNYLKHQEAIEAHQRAIRNVLSDRSSSAVPRK